MRLWIGITDGDWYRHLSRKSDVDEVNFWQPSGSRAFRALQPGEPLSSRSQITCANNGLRGGQNHRQNGPGRKHD